MSVLTRGNPPLVVKGLLDLRHWDFATDGLVKLDGEWEFYWEKLLLQTDFDRRPDSQPLTYFRFPALWNGFIIDGKVFQGHGYATLSLLIKLPESQAQILPKLLALKLDGAKSAYALYANGSLIAHNGVVGKDHDSMLPGWIPMVSQSFDATSEIRLILQISNFHHRHGGIVSSIEIGLWEETLKKRTTLLVQDVFIAGCIFLMGIYHIILFLLRRSNKSVLFFGIFCFLITLRSLLTNEGILRYLYSDFSWEILNKGEYLGAYLGLGVFVVYVRSLFPIVFGDKATVFFTIASVIFALFAIAFPVNFYSYVNDYFHGFVIIYFVYAIYSLISAVKFYMKDVIIFAIGFLFIVFASIHDILVVQNIIQPPFIIHFGLLFFLLAQSCLLSLRFSRAFAQVELLSAELRNKNLELVKLDKMKDEFLSNISHEIRTPLGVILGYIETLEDADSVGEVKKLLPEIASNGHTLNKVIEKMLLIGDIDSGVKYTLIPVLLSEALKITLLSLSKLADQKQVKIVSDIPRKILVKADEILLERIFTEVIENAIIYNKPGGSVFISAAAAEKTVTVTIQDTGVGIPQYELLRIWEKFYRVDSTLTYSVGGVGMGLYIAKKLTQQLGGAITAKSTVKSGTVINIEFEKI